MQHKTILGVEWTARRIQSVVGVVVVVLLYMTGFLWPLLRFVISFAALCALVATLILIYKSVKPHLRRDTEAKDRPRLEFGLPLISGAATLFLLLLLLIVPDDAELTSTSDPGIDVIPSSVVETSDSNPITASSNSTTVIDPNPKSNNDEQLKLKLLKRDPAFGTSKPDPAVADEGLPSNTPSDEGPPSSFPPKQPASAADRIIQRLLSADSMKYADRGYAGFTFGDSYDSLMSKLKEKAEGNPEEVWVDTKDWVQLLFCKNKLVGVMKMYNSTVRDSSDALVERFGKAPPERITEFGSVLRSDGNSYTGAQILIRYCFRQCIVYGYISSGEKFITGDLSRAPAVPFMLVSVFDREYLEGVLRRDIQQKEHILEAARPVIFYAFGTSLKWDAIPFPKVDGTTSGYGVNHFKENVAKLDGREAPHGTQAQMQMRGKSAIFVREQTATGRRTMFVKIGFNSFPTFEMHTLTAPQANSKIGWLQWLPSRGNWHVEHDAQRCNAMLVGEMFPSADGKMEVSTVANSVKGNWFLNIEHKSMKVYTWETAEKYTVQVLDSNTIVVIKRDKPTID